MSSLIVLDSAIKQMALNHSVFAGYPLNGGPNILVVRKYPDPDGMEIYFIEPNGVDDGLLTHLLPVNARSAILPFPDMHQLSMPLYRTSETKMAARLRNDYEQLHNDLRLRQLTGRLPSND